MRDFNFRSGIAFIGSNTKPALCRVFPLFLLRHSCQGSHSGNIPQTSRLVEELPCGLSFFFKRENSEVEDASSAAGLCGSTKSHPLACSAAPSPPFRAYQMPSSHCASTSLDSASATSSAGGLVWGILAPVKAARCSLMTPNAYFSDRGRPLQSERGRCFSVIVDGLGRHASPGLNVAQSSTISLKRPAVWRRRRGRFSGWIDLQISGPCQAAGGAPTEHMYSCSVWAAAAPEQALLMPAARWRCRAATWWPSSRSCGCCVQLGRGWRRPASDR